MLKLLCLLPTGRTFNDVVFFSLLQEVTLQQAEDNTVLDTLIPLNGLEVFSAPETLSMLLTILACSYSGDGGGGDAFQKCQKH